MKEVRITGDAVTVETTVTELGAAVDEMVAGRAVVEEV